MLEKRTNKPIQEKRITMLPSDVKIEEWSLIGGYLLAGYTILWVFRRDYLTNIDLGIRIIFESALIGFTIVFMFLSFQRSAIEKMDGEERNFDSLKFLRAILLLAGGLYTFLTIMEIISMY